MRLADRDLVLAFLAEAYAETPRMSEGGFWDWHFPENPFVSPDDLPVWLAKSGGRIAGQLAAIPVELQIGDRRRRAMWILDLIVHEDFRRKGIAKRLVLKAEEFCGIGLGINTTKQHSTAVLESLGWKVVRQIPRYSKLLYAGNVLPEVARFKPLRKTLNFLSAPARPAADKTLFGAGGSLRLIEKFDAAFDDLWEEACGQWSCAVVRSARFLEWQYARQPGKKFDVIGCFEGEKLLGYAVLFVRKPDASGTVAKAAITDLCYHPSKAGEIIEKLVRGAVQIAAERGAGVLVTDAADDLIEAGLKSSGFARVKNPMQLIVKSNESADVLLDPGKWFLTRGDSDISIFEHPNV